MSAIESNYSINIAEMVLIDPKVLDGARRYRHYARLELGACFESIAEGKLADTRERYPFPAFKVDLTYYECVGHSKPAWRQ